MMEKDIFSLSNYEYAVPREVIAQTPVYPRDSSRLLVASTGSQQIKEVVFRDVVSLLKPHDVLVMNNTRVIQARLMGQKKTGSPIEVLLLSEKAKGVWEALLKPAKRARISDVICFGSGALSGTIIETTNEGTRLIQFNPPDIMPLLSRFGKTPLPPYIKAEPSDPGVYQTVYAEKEGAVAAPTAGLHFTPELLTALARQGVETAQLTLHCGLATFRPVKVQDIREHRIATEWLEITPAAAEIINRAKKDGRKVIAVGTTSLRALESAASQEPGKPAMVKPYTGSTGLYIVPGYRFKIVDSLITNFHTPASTNLILTAAFLGLELTRKAYAYALRHKFRFFSFGDAMFIC